MELLRDIYEQGRRAAVDVLNGEGIEHSSPHSPDVHDDLRSWLPDLFDRFPIVLPWEKPQPIDPALHNVWILDNTAFRTPQPGDDRPELAELQDPNVTQPKRKNDALPGQQSTEPVRAGSGWEVEFVACYFIKNSGKDLAKVNAALVHHLDVSDHDETTKKRISARLEPFVDTVLPNRTLRISIDNKEEQTLAPFQPSIQNGQSPSIQSNAVNLPPPFGLPSTTILAEESGWGVISDIDDTIKVTQTPNPIGILRNTFTVEAPEPIEKMPELYAYMSSTLNTPTFFYLSASPYNLYPLLKSFRDAHYPPGTIILRDASWQNLGGLIASLNQNTKEYKDDRIVKIHSWFPHRKFVCLGDSTQSDPEAYGEAARKYPGWIKAVFIRKVTGLAGMDEAKENAPERFEKAFGGLDRKLWHVFTDPGELAERVDELSRNENALVGGD